MSLTHQPLVNEVIAEVHFGERNLTGFRTQGAQAV